MCLPFCEMKRSMESPDLPSKASDIRRMQSFSSGKFYLFLSGSIRTCPWFSMKWKGELKGSALMSGSIDSHKLWFTWALNQRASSPILSWIGMSWDVLAPATWIDLHNTDSREREMTCGMFRDVLAPATWIDSLNTDSREREMTCIDSRERSKIIWPVRAIFLLLL